MKGPRWELQMQQDERSCVLQIIIIIILAGESAALDEKNLKEKESGRPTQPQSYRWIRWTEREPADSFYLQY
jgi:hypothetical protein